VGPLRVCIDARIEGGLLGGVEQVVIGLAAGLSRLEDGSERYFFLTHRGADDWIRPYLRGPCRPLHVGHPPERVLRAYQRKQKLAGWFPFIQPPPLVPPPAGRLMASDGTIEFAGIDLVHFPCQMAFMTKIPSIYHPHDLQHLHLPEFFSEKDHFLRGLWYPSFCGQASLVVMMTSWGRADLIEKFRLPPEKVAVVNWGSVLFAYPDPSTDDLEAARANLRLPRSFLLYPAQTWPHKNHERLIEALAIVRDRHGVQIPVICPGRPTELQPELEERARELGVAEALRFPGFVTPLELRCLYQLATGLVFPSRFEGWGMPISEAFASGLPVASSSATGLPELVGDAGLIFDPLQPDEIADRVWRLWTDGDLRADLAERGRRRAELFSVERAAKLFRAHYRQIGRRRLSAEDRELLALQPLA
jgi:glycosyltransferase involved in cell wall biosynthesis